MLILIITKASCCIIISLTRESTSLLIYFTLDLYCMTFQNKIINSNLSVTLPAKPSLFKKQLKEAILFYKMSHSSLKKTWKIASLTVCLNNSQSSLLWYSCCFNVQESWTRIHWPKNPNLKLLLPSYLAFPVLLVGF